MKVYDLSLSQVTESYCWSMLNEAGEVELFSGFNSFYGVGSRITKEKRIETVNTFIDNFSYLFRYSEVKEYFRKKLIYFLCEHTGTKEDKLIKVKIREELMSEANAIGNYEFKKRIEKLLFRPINESYIPIPYSRLFHQLHPNFFVPEGISFNENGRLITSKGARTFKLVFEPSGDSVDAFIDQDWGKGIETTESMGKLGEWVLRGVFQLKEHEPLTARKLKDVGINGIRLYKTADSDAVHFEFIWIDNENLPNDYWSI